MAAVLPPMTSRRWWIRLMLASRSSMRSSDNTCQLAVPVAGVTQRWDRTSPSRPRPTHWHSGVYYVRALHADRGCLAEYDFTRTPRFWAPGGPSLSARRIRTPGREAFTGTPSANASGRHDRADDIQNRSQRSPVGKRHAAPGEGQLSRCSSSSLPARRCMAR